MVHPLRITVGVKTADVGTRHRDVRVAWVTREVGVGRAVKRVIQCQRDGDFGRHQPTAFADEVQPVVKKLTEIGQPTVARCDARIDLAKE